jgi:hypothetical protein
MPYRKFMGWADPRTIRGKTIRGTLSGVRTVNGDLVVENGRIRSGNFSGGTSGWAIWGDGSAEFNDVTLRGDLSSSNWNGTDPANLSGGPDSGATTGYYLDHSAGAAQFQTIYAEGGQLEALTVTGALTLGTGGSIFTDSSTPRIEITDSQWDRIVWVSGNSNMTADAMLDWSDAGDFLGIGLFGYQADGPSPLPFVRLITDDPAMGGGTSAYVELFGSFIWLNAPVYVDAGSAGSAAIYFEGGGVDTGIFCPGSDQVSVTANGTERIRVDATSTAGQTALLLYDVDNATLERVTVGAADSGGSGYKVLRIPN